MKIRALIVDDEPHARFRVKHLLKVHPEILIESECRNGAEAVKAIKESLPDLVFLDIQMPDFNGFQVLEKTQSVSKKPDVIFITAYDEYALKAFEKHAMDYLLKPLDEDRFNEALVRLKQSRKNKQSWYSNELAKEYDRIRSERDSDISFEVSSKGSSKKIYPEEIVYAEADGNYVQIHLTNQKYLYRSSLSDFCEKLSSHPFLRIHRTVVINTESIQTISYSGNNEYKITLITGTEFKSGRTYKAIISAYNELK